MHVYCCCFIDNFAVYLLHISKVLKYTYLVSLYISTSFTITVCLYLSETHLACSHSLWARPIGIPRRQGPHKAQVLLHVPLVFVDTSITSSHFHTSSTKLSLCHLRKISRDYLCTYTKYTAIDCMSCTDHKSLTNIRYMVVQQIANVTNV